MVRVNSVQQAYEASGVFPIAGILLIGVTPFRSILHEIEIEVIIPILKSLQ